MFQSDFRAVADYFIQIRKNKDYQPSPQELKHVHEVLQLLSVMTKDNRFEKAYQDNMKGKGEKMCEVLDRIEQQGIKKGLKKGIKQGIKQGMEKGIRKGENRFASLIRHLNADHREAEIQKAAADRQYREQLYQEYHL